MLSSNNDYYTNNDYEPERRNYKGYDPGFGNEYYDIKSNPSLDSFKVRPLVINVIVSIIVFATIIFTSLSLSPVRDIARSTDNPVIKLQFFVIRLIPFILICLLLPTIGRSIEIAGKDITITKLFFFKEKISIYDVEYCDYMTGLRTRNGTYSKMIIHYNKTKVSFTDTGFNNWGQLIKYMTKFDKIRHVDGRDPVTKFFDRF